MRRSQPLTTLPLFLAIALVASQALAADFTGRVVGVSDGDILTVLSKGKPVRIRLQGIAGRIGRPPPFFPRLSSFCPALELGPFLS